MSRHSLAILLGLVLCLPCRAQPATGPADPVADGLREAFRLHQKGDAEALAAKLRELTKMVEDKGAAKVAVLLPDKLGDWKAGELRREDLAALGGGISLARKYESGEKSVSVKVVKDSPLAKQFIPLLLNEDLMRASGRKSHRISGETGYMEGERKLQMVLAGTVYLELAGNGTTSENDLVEVARGLDLRALGKLKKPPAAE